MKMYIYPFLPINTHEYLEWEFIGGIYLASIFIVVMVKAKFIELIEKIGFTFFNTTK